MYGADSEALEGVASEVDGESQKLTASQVQLGRAIHASPWNGRNADRFRQQWDSEYRRAMVQAATFLTDAGEALRRNAEEQRDASSEAGAVPGLTAAQVKWLQDALADIFGPGGAAEQQGSELANLLEKLAEVAGDIKYGVGIVGKVLTLRTLIEVLASRHPQLALEMLASLGGKLPFTQGGLVNLASHFPGLGDFGIAMRAWTVSPAGRAILTKFGLAFGVVGTVWGAYDIYKAGNPVDAFNRDPAGYVSMVSGTLFSAAGVGVILLAGTAAAPFVVGAAIVTGVVYLGAEVWKHFGDDISHGVSSAWNWTSNQFSSAAGAVGHAVGDAAHAVGGAVGGAAHAVGDAVDGAVEGAKHLVDDPIGTLGSWL